MLSAWHVEMETAELGELLYGQGEHPGVPGHKGVAGCEIAGSFAGEAARTKPTTRKATSRETHQPIRPQARANRQSTPGMEGDQDGRRPNSNPKAVWHERGFAKLLAGGPNYTSTKELLGNAHFTANALEGD